MKLLEISDTSEREVSAIVQNFPRVWPKVIRQLVKTRSGIYFAGLPIFNSQGSFGDAVHRVVYMLKHPGIYVDLDIEVGKYNTVAHGEAKASDVEVFDVGLDPRLNRMVVIFKCALDRAEYRDALRWAYQEIGSDYIPSPEYIDKRWQVFSATNNTFYVVGSVTQKEGLLGIGRANLPNFTSSFSKLDSLERWRNEQELKDRFIPL